MKNQFFFLVNKFINRLMIDGAKLKAENLFVKSLFIVKKRGLNPLFIFLYALENTKPSVELRSVRRGGTTYQIPVPINNKRSISLSMKWILEVARQKKGSMVLNLTETLLEASKNNGDSVKKKEVLHIIALKNRSLTHFRWF